MARLIAWSPLPRSSLVARRFAVVPLTLAIACAILGCSSSLPTPTTAIHPVTAFIEVPYPPPAALVEVVPDQPEADSDSVWVDGHWVWRGRYYVWQRGGWLHPPENAGYASWQAHLAKDGRMMFAPGAWYDSAQRLLPNPELMRVARTPPNQTTVETETPR